MSIYVIQYVCMCVNAWTIRFSFGYLNYIKFKSPIHLKTFKYNKIRKTVPVK